jgi:cell division transport system permease protein
MSVALVLIGLFMLLTYEAQHVSTWLRQRVGELEIFLDEDVEDALAKAINARADATDGVAETEFVSKARAQAVFREEFGEEGSVFFDQPFLPASIKVRVEPNYANPDSLQSLVERFQGWSRVDEVIFNQPLLLKVQDNLRLITSFGVWLGVLVMLASVFLVANTIRLTIYARRLLIRTMKLVGATDAFVRRPFVVEGMLQGAIAAGLASIAVFMLYGFLSSYLPQIAQVGGGTFFLFVALIIASGIALGWLGSFLASRRFIRNVALH